MTRTAHHAHPTPGFPVFCMAFTDDTHLLLGGGGGASRTGIVNKLKLYAVDKTGEKLEGLHEHVFEKGADSPNTLAVDPSRKQVIVGVNEPENRIQESPKDGNRHCRLLDYTDEFKQVAAVQVITEPWSDNYPYQKHTSIHPRGTLVALATTNYDATFSRISILALPELRIIVADLAAEVGGSGGEVVDLDWSADGALFAVTTPAGVDLYNIDASDKARLTFEQTIPPPRLDTTNPVIFRAARFARPVASSASSSPVPPPPPPTLHCIFNARPQPKQRTKNPGAKRASSPPERAYACNLSLPRSSGEDKPRGNGERTWDVVARRDVGGRPVTAMQVSADGRLLAYASSDLSIGILDARTLTPLLKILHAHSFPTTALAFNPSGTLLASSSADNTVRLVVVPESFGSSSMMVLSLVVAVLLVLIALYIQYRA